MAPSGPQTDLEEAYSSSFRYASEPANCAEPSRMALRPAPEPSGEYCTLAPELAEAKFVFQASMAAPWAEEPMPVSVPVTLVPPADWEPAGAVPVALSEPQAESASAPAAITAIAAWRPKRSAFTRCTPSRVIQVRDRDGEPCCAMRTFCTFKKVKGRR